nr:endonuclease [uncultured Flavobacterium sp.]
MKKIFTLVLLSSAFFGFSQIPPGYYNTATGTGYTLKTQLFNIINDHNDRGYAGLYVTYATSDIDSYYENNGSMLDMYTENPTGSECEFIYGGGLQDDGTLGNNECERYNREHIIPQSVFGSATPMYSDAHFVVPSDKYVNAQRGDLPFSKVNVPNNTYSNGGKRGSNLNSGYSAGYNGTVFEPIDEFKGDIARMILYFATRYEDLVAGWSYTMFNGTSTQVFTNQSLNVLLTWNAQDPVSQREIDRNNAIYTRQNNRNPFIDNNNYVTQIWGLPLANPTFDDLETVKVYPNPTKDIINIESATALTEIEIITINGQVLQQIKNPVFNNSTYSISNLPKGFYFVKMSNENNSITKKVLVN